MRNDHPVVMRTTILSTCVRSFLVLVAVACSIAILLGQIYASDASNLLSSFLTGYGLLTTLKPQQKSTYLIGVGRADITGPVVELNFMGYADSDQSGTGLRQRLYCRAFVVVSSETPVDRILYLVLDTQSGDTAIRHGILQGLEGLGSEYAVYNSHNVAVTGTHSHSGPGAWLNYLLPQITSKGFSKESFDAIVQGSIRAIKEAHATLAPGYLSIGSINTTGISVNRSPYAYLANPEDERIRYPTDTDTEMTLLKFTNASNGVPIGALNWLPVHGTSLYQNNTLVTGDNKGVAAYLLEESMSKISPSFVAGFSQANVGDTSPNTLGAFCEDTGLQCRFNDSTCNGQTQGCHGRGPFFDAMDYGTKSCFEIGRRQFEAAQQLLQSTNLKELEFSTVAAYHVFANLSSFTFRSPFNTSEELQTCSAALGYGFAGGTTDGPGKFDFRQGTNDTDDDSPALKNPLWRFARSFVHNPSDKQVACQRPKPILLDVGAALKPYPWTPNIVDIQVLRVGALVLVVSPGEATTMAGRRWREMTSEAVKKELSVPDPVVMLGGPANTYAHYIATKEEYSVQRYEGASTLYGQHTLEAYINLTLSYLPYLGNERRTLPTLSGGPPPPINVNTSLSFISPVVVDNPGFFKKFGQCLSSPESSDLYLPGQVVGATFVGANPRNNLRLGGTFAAVERFDSMAGGWVQVRSDRDWHLVYQWQRTSTTLGTSTVTISWEIEEDAADIHSQQLYRMRYYGDAKSLDGSITPFEGTSGTFQVASPSLAAMQNEMTNE